MKQTHFCTMGLLALVLMAANAKAATENFTLAQTAKPITRTYPGVDASILGIRTGMTVSQAEAVAKKSYSKETPGSAVPLSFFFTGGKFQTKPLVPYVAFSKQTAHAGDYLTLYFTTPATDSTIYYITRNINFNAGGANGTLPPIDAITASLIKKYGPASYQEKIGASAVQSGVPGQEGKLVLAWIFNKDSRLSCQSRTCVGRMIQGEAMNLGESKPQYDQFLRQMCGTSAGSPAVFKIVATIDASGKGKTTADGVTVSMWDAQACVDDGDQVFNQFNAAVAQLTKPKPQASLPGASESVPPGSGPLSFYGDIGNGIGNQSSTLVRPSRLLLTEDGSVALLHLQWSDWGKGIARATGVWSASSCTPNCAAGKPTTSPARLTLWSPGLVSGHWVYRCFQIDPRHPKRDIYDRACIQGDGYNSLPK